MKHFNGMLTALLLTAAAVPTLRGETPAPAAAAPWSHLLSPLPDGYLDRAAHLKRLDIAGGSASELQTLLTRHDPLTAAEADRLLFLLATDYAATGDPRALALLEQYIADNPVSPLAVQAALSRGDLYFYAGKFSRAVVAYREVDFSALDPAAAPGATYRYALSLIRSGYMAEARGLMHSLLYDRDYAREAGFYCAYIQYAEGDYKSAADGFRQVSDIPWAAYYLNQIDYLQGDYEACAAGSRQLLQRLEPGSDEAGVLMPETQRLAGMSLFRIGEPDLALPYLRRYVDEAGEGADADALYALGSILYGRDDLEEAANCFSRISSLRDSLGQGALLYLGQIAVRLNDPSGAALFFEKASRMGFDRNVTRSALYNYGAANSRGARVPFADQAAILESFLSLFPDATRARQVEGYLAMSYYMAGDYEKALNALGNVRDREADGLRQLILFEQGKSRLRRDKNAEAVRSLQQAEAIGGDNKELMADIRLWLGDALFATGNWHKSADAYTFSLRGLKGAEEKAVARYGRGYCRLRTSDWKGAAEDFRYVADDKSAPSPLRADARVRLADCLYYSADFGEAITAYNRAFSDHQAGSPTADYILWRIARARGLNGDEATMLSGLERLHNSRVSSLWGARIACDLAEAYAEAGKTAKAEEAYRSVIINWPESDEAGDADAALRRICAADGRLAEYADFLKAHSSRRLETSEMEQLAFDAAAEAYNASGSYTRLEQYIADYPGGANAAEALWMLARGREADGKDEAAAKAYEQLIRKGSHEYTLPATAGLMRTTPDPSVRLKYARQLQTTGGLTAEETLEARYMEADALSLLGKETEAERIWHRLADNPASLWGARSAVTLGERMLDRGNPAGAAAVLTHFVDSGSQQTYWTARAYITLADVYTRQGKDFLARQYLETLRDNYPGSEPDIRRMIETRLKKLQ